MFFSKFSKGLKALNAGESLTKAAAWKNVQMATNAVVVIVTFCLTLFPETINMTDTDVQKLAGAIVTVVGLVNAYLVPATSKKVGLPAKTEEEK